MKGVELYGRFAMRFGLRGLSERAAARGLGSTRGL